MKHLQNNKGFTLIELMIVVVIIGILAAIAIPRFTSFGDDARQSEGEQILSNIHTNQEMYRARIGGYTDSFGALATEVGFSPAGMDDATAAALTNTFESDYYSFSVALDAPNGFCVTATPLASWAGGADRLVYVTESGRISEVGCADSRTA